MAVPAAGYAAEHRRRANRAPRGGRAPPL